MTGIRRPVTYLVVALLLVLAAACSDADGPDDRGGRSPSPGVATLRIPAGTTAAQVTGTLTVLRRRLDRLGVTATVRAGSGTVTVDPDPGPFVLEALARRDPTRIASVEATTLGPCANGGTPSFRPDHRCHVLAPTSVGTAAVARTKVRATGLDGYGVDVTIADARWPAWRDAFQARRATPVAIVAGDRVLTTATLAAPALQTRISGQLSRADARRIATALLVDEPLPVGLAGPSTPGVDGPTAHDVWNTSLAVIVCGRPLGPAPSFTTEEGVHSHGDGYVYVHSLPTGAAGGRPRLGEFARLGDWTIAEDRLDLWDGERHDAAHPCPGASDAVVRWTVDGVEQTGSPAALRLAPGQVVVIRFGPRTGPIPPAPHDAGLLTTRWSAVPVD
jgi:hypothetical protein